MEKLFLLNPNFQDVKVDGTDQLYYCPHNAMIEGLLNYYPDLKHKIEIIHIDFPRPRKQLVALVGEENQGCPNLVISKDNSEMVDTSYFYENGENLFTNKKELIARYLGDKYQIGKSHP